MTNYGENSLEYKLWCKEHKIKPFKKETPDFSEKRFKNLYEDQLIYEFKQYLLNTEAIKYVSVTEHGSELHINKMDYVNRWSASYKAKYQARLEQLNDWFLLNPRPITFMTLTSYQPDGLLITDQIMELKRGWHHLSQNMRKNYPGIDYIWSFDFHESGYAHYHIILFESIKPVDIIR